MKKLKINPSVASANQMYLAEELSSFAKDVPLHMDIEDGNYVYNISFGMRTIHSVASMFPDNPLDFHMNCMHPAAFYEDLAKFNTRYVILPWEIADAPMREIDRIHDLGMKACISLTMRHPINVLETLIPEADAFLLMTYGSGKGGMNGLGFREMSLDRIRQLRSMMGPERDLIIDGGIGIKELKLAYEAGADNAVLGRLIFPEVKPEKGKQEGRVLLPSEREKTPQQLLSEILAEY